MFERYTEASKRAVFFARYEASEAGHAEIAPEHLLLGIMHDEQSRTDQLFGLRQNEYQIRSRIFEATPKSVPLAKDKDLPVTNACKQVLVFAAEESDLLNDKCIDAEHLLLGIFRLPSLTATKCLNELGLNLEQAREKVRLNPVPGRIRQERTSPTYSTPKESRWNFWGLIFLVLVAVTVILLALRLR